MIIIFINIFVFSPPVNPPKEIEDSNDKKPDDWDERERSAAPTVLADPKFPTHSTPSLILYHVSLTSPLV